MELTELQETFLSALELADAIGGTDVFRLPRTNTKRRRPSAPLFDGIMVALMRHLEHAEQIKGNAADINRTIQAEFENTKFYELIVGRANTRAATIKRSQYIESLIKPKLAD